MQYDKLRAASSFVRLPASDMPRICLGLGGRGRLRLPPAAQGLAPRLGDRRSHHPPTGPDAGTLVEPRHEAEEAILCGVLPRYLAAQASLAQHENARGERQEFRQLTGDQQDGASLGGALVYP